MDNKINNIMPAGSAGQDPNPYSDVCSIISNARAEYGKQVIKNLAQQLIEKYGKG